MLPRNQGKIINIGSIMCEEAGLNIPAYTAAKHGIAGLTKALAVGWAGKGINVNCIAPGYFETNINTSLRNHPVRGPQNHGSYPGGPLGAAARNWRDCASSWHRRRAPTCTAAWSSSTAAGWHGDRLMGWMRTVRGDGIGWTKAA